MPDGAKKGITVKVDVALHAEVSAFIREHGMTMSEFVVSALDNELHPKITEKEGDNMASTRTVAFQVPEDVYQFQHDELTCLLFPFSGDVQLDTGKLAMWRLGTYSQFGGTWLTDFVENDLGGFENERVKPDCALIGTDGNIFALSGKAARTLKQNGMSARLRIQGFYR